MGTNTKKKFQVDFWHRNSRCMDIMTIKPQDLWLTIGNNTGLEAFNHASGGIYFKIKYPFSIQHLN